MATFHGGLPSCTTSNEAIGLNASGLIDGFDADLAFDESMLENVNGGLTIPFTPSYDFETFSTTFEDPFNYPRPYEATPDPSSETYHDEESSPQQLDDKLLGFSVPVLIATPIDDATGKFSELNMSAELYGMFFVAEDVFGGETTGRPLELTCYRRNLWQCSGQITLPRHCTKVLNEQGRAIPLVEFYASISAIESIEGKATEIISIPWKSSNPLLGEGQETKTAGPPPKIVLDLSGGQEVDGHRVTIPVSWKRLQFKSATANNGRRKGLQQHYLVQISLLGKMKTGGEFIKIAEVHSGAVIVRGRSPRNFDSRKDVSLSGDIKKSGSVERSRTSKPVPTLKQENSEERYLGANQNRQYPSKKVALSPRMNRPPVPTWDRNSSKTPTSRPISLSLSLSEDERSPNRPGPDLQSPKLNRTYSKEHGSPGDEETEQLYEYFPLSVDDWTPLVDTVYRPHIVHHISLPSEIKAQKVRSKAKRYFSAE